MEEGRKMHGYRLLLIICLLFVRVSGYVRVLENYHAPDLNVLLMIADDLGIGDLGCYGNVNARTPNLDNLAKEGLKLTRMYSVPSDAGGISAILTGREPKRFGLVKGQSGKFSFESPAQTGGVGLFQNTLARTFNRYRLQAFYTGKWNFGFSSDKLPTSIGFQSFFGTLMPHSVSCSTEKEHRYTDFEAFMDLIKDICPIIISLVLMIIISRAYKVMGIFSATICLLAIASGVVILRIHCWTSMYNPNSCIFMENNVVREQPYKDDRMTLRLTDHVVRFIKYRASDVQPFLYVMSFMQPNFPSARSYMFRNRTGLGPYKDAVHELDWSVGKILKALEEKNLDKNTIIIFISDNSPSQTNPVNGEPLKEDKRGKSCISIENGKLELKGEKGSNFEGGLRVPAIIRFPGKTKKGSVSHAVTSVMDIYATIYDIFKFKKSKEEGPYDGKSLLPLIHNPDLTPPSVIHEQLYHYCDLKEVGAVTVGNIKIHFRNGTLRDCSGPLLHQPLIYNITADPGETTPLPVRDFMQLVYHVRASIKKYEMISDIDKVKESQFDEIPMPYNFPCLDFLSCTENYDQQETFNTILF